jgi:trk system potassium uptake protein TrkA
MMKIIICGIGRVGLSIASYLSMQDNEITVIDADPNLVKRVSDTYDIAGIVGHASQPDILKKAGAETADIIIAVTDCDEVNMVACQVAHSVFGIHRKIARIRNKEYRDPAWSNLFSRNHMPIDIIISPEEEIADAILKRMSIPGTTNDIALSDNHFHVSGLIIGETNPICGETIKNIYFANKIYEFRIFLIIRNGQELNSTDQTILHDGDEIHILCERAVLIPLLENLGVNIKTGHNRVIISGCGVIGEAIANRLSEDTQFKASNLTIIEQNTKRARAISQILPKALILSGSALDYDILKEAGSDNASVFVSVMDSNENNILSAMLAKKMGADYTIALSTNRLYTQLLPDQFIDAIVNPETITVSRILHNLKRGHIRSIHTIRDTGIEIIEAEITENCGIINIPMSELSLHDGIKILGFYRPETEQITFASDSCILKSGDVVIIVANNVSVAEVEKLFSFSINLF